MKYLWLIIPGSKTIHSLAIPLSLKLLFFACTTEVHLSFLVSRKVNRNRDMHLH